jgi:hypothetical protein
MTADQLLAELAATTAERVRLDERRDELVRALMRMDAADAPRERIAEAAGLKVARLYQIRDGRR